MMQWFAYRRLSTVALVAGNTVSSNFCCRMGQFDGRLLSSLCAVALALPCAGNMSWIVSQRFQTLLTRMQGAEVAVSKHADNLHWQQPRR